MAKAYNVEYVFIDMSPSMTALNRCMLMSCHYIILPTIPDLYSAESIRRLEQYIEENWIPLTKKIIEYSHYNKYPFPSHYPKFLGYIMSRYDIKKQGEIKDGIVEDIVPDNIAYWQKEIDERIDNLLKRFKRHSPPLALLKTYSSCLAKIKNFNSLGVLSQICNRPIWNLQKDELKRFKDGEWQKLNSSDARSNIAQSKEYSEIYDNLVINILNLIN